MKRSLLVLPLIALAFALPVRAQEPVVGVPDPETLFTSKDRKLNANKQVVLHIVRDLLEAGHWGEATKYLTTRYLQHNPNVPSSLAAVTKAFAGRPKGAIPARDQWKTKVVAVVAEGDLVAVAFVRELPHPTQTGKTYTTTWFDMWRIKDGKADEHWDGATIAPPPGAWASPNR